MKYSAIYLPLQLMELASQPCNFAEVLQSQNFLAQSRQPLKSLLKGSHPRSGLQSVMPLRQILLPQDNTAEKEGKMEGIIIMLQICIVFMVIISLDSHNYLMREEDKYLHYITMRTTKDIVIEQVSSRDRTKTHLLCPLVPWSLYYTMRFVTLQLLF